MQFPRLIVMSVLCLCLAACEEEQAAQTQAPAVRAIKHMALDQRAGLQQRRIAGIVKAAVSTNVGFEINGQIVELLRKSGDAVEAGELIARLDPEPSRLQVAQARNTLAQQQATLDDAQKKFDQQQQLRTQGYATQTALDSAEAALKTAQGAVGVAESQLDLAERDLAKTDLKAPFTGVIARRAVEVFEEVGGGQTIYAIQSDGEDKVEASLPETLINSVSLGSGVDVSFPPLGNVAVKGMIDEIAPLAGDANAYPIEIKLENAPPGLRAGMSAELIFRFETEATGKAFMVPMTAILPRLGSEDGSIFVYDADSGTLDERPVTVTNVENNSLEIVGELAAGEIVATAGVSFLHDGMAVTLFDSDLLK